MIKACVIGWPIEHSRSPLIHRYWLDRYGIDGAYEKVAVPPEEVEGFLARLGQAGFAGCNATIPHKEAAFRIAGRTDAAARAIGAANTLWLDQASGLCAGNTDAYGFMTHLRERAPGWRAEGATVMLLGAGGAARAIIYGLSQAGVGNVLLVNRNVERAEALAEAFAERANVQVLSWEEAPAALARCSLLVNATSLGMAGQATLDLSLETLPRDAVVADIVYSPLRTDLLARAAARGNPIVDGLGMLLHQAVPSFERWFGVRPEVTAELRALIEADLQKEAC